jgi:alpha-glucosidase (family GH31 glycosyl hydrolase)
MAGPPVIENESLRLELKAAPAYGYRLIDRATGRILIEQAQTELEIDGNRCMVNGADGISLNDGRLHGALHLDNGRSGRFEFSFDGRENLRVRLSGPSQAQPDRIIESFVDQPGTRYYGLTEKGDRLNMRGQRLDIDGEFEDIGGSRCEPARAPFFFTSENVGVYAPVASPGQFHFAREGRTTMDLAVGSLEYRVMVGDHPREVLRRYNQLAGGSFIPPDWALQSMWWRNETNQRELLADAAHLAEHRIHAGAMWIDRPYAESPWGWGSARFDPNRFPDPPAVAQQLAAHGLKLMLWTANRFDGRWKDQARQAGFLFADHKRPGIDVRQAQARRWMKQRLDDLVAQVPVEGRTWVHGYKIDRGGEGRIPAESRNQLVSLFNELSQQQIGAHHPDQWFILSRSVFDTSRRHVGHWNGDTDASWEGLAGSVRQAIRCGLINFPVWGSDTGGYHRSGEAGGELMARWLGFSAYTSVFEVMLDRWDQVKDDPQIVAIARRHARDHHLLMPYLRSALYRASQTGAPVIGAMFLDQPGDANLHDMDEQYMFGPSLLVAPVLEDGARRRRVYFPAGEWINFNQPSQRIVSRGQWRWVEAPLEIVPCFARAGAIVPRGDVYRGNNTWDADRQAYLDVELFVPSKPRSVSRFDHFDGTRIQHISFQKTLDQLRIQLDGLGIDGTLRLNLDQRTDQQLRDQTWQVFMNGQPIDADQYTHEKGRLSIDHGRGIDLVLRPAGGSNR